MTHDAVSADPAPTPAGGQFDVVVLGGGSGGYAAAFRASQLGMSVALIEKDKLGGTCLHYGCIPTKALLHAAEMADAAREAVQFGVKASFDGVDVETLGAYRDDVVSRLHKGLLGLAKERRVTLVAGEGRLATPNVVEVSGARYEGRHVILATGSRARQLPGVEVDGDHVLTSYEALALDRVPRSAVVLGGGVIGVEFASLWRSLGAEVTVVEALPRLIPGEDEAASTMLARAFRRRGVAVKTGATLAGAERADGGVRVRLDNGESLEADVLLVAVGRAPVTDGVGYEDAGVALDSGFVVVDERLRTNLPGVYAVGDIVRGLQLAHRGFAHGIFAAEEIAGLRPAPVEDAGIPRVAYCEPEVASVGLTQAQAAERFGPDQVEAVEHSLAGNGRSQILKTQGLAKVVREKGGRVLGVHLVGSRVGELVAEAQLMVNWDALPDDVAQLIHPHPTQSEALGEACLALAGKPLHVHA